MSSGGDAIEIAKYQKEIESYLSLGNTSVIFDFDEIGSAMRVHVITINPRHNQSFLFHSIDGHDKLDGLKKMLDYVKTYKERENSYTLQWTLKGQNELNTSYFRAKDIPEALNKLFYGRDPNSVTIFSVVLNPIS